MKSYRFVLLALLGFVVITRCTGAQGTTKNLATVHSDEVAHGMSAARLARIAPAMKEHIDRNNLPGAVTLVARHGVSGE